MNVAVAAVAAAALAAFIPLLLRVLPEPPEPADDKILYRDLAAPRLLTPIAMAFAALFAGTVAWRAESTGAIGLWAFLAAVGVLLAYIDWRTRLLPILIVVPSYGAVTGLLLLAAWIDDDWSALMTAALCGLAVFAFYFCSWLFIPRSIGYGDVRLSGIIGLSLGYVGVTTTVVGWWLGFAVGALTSVILVAPKRFARQRVPFGPSMLLGLWLGLILVV